VVGGVAVVVVGVAVVVVGVAVVVDGVAVVVVGVAVVVVGVAVVVDGAALSGLPPQAEATKSKQRTALNFFISQILPYTCELLRVSFYVSDSSMYMNETKGAGK